MKRLFIFIFIIIFPSLGFSQNIEGSLKLPEGMKIMQSAIPADNSGVYVLVLDLMNNYYFYYSQIIGSHGFGVALPIDSLNKSIPAGIKIQGFCVSSDNQEIYFSANFSGGLGGFDIYSCTREKQSWSAPKNMGAPINTFDDEYEPSVSSDKNSIFFTRPVEEKNDFTDDFKCKKIYVAEKNVEGKWEKPYELTKPINLYCECNPVIAPDNKTLYFSSVREDNKKGFDIMYTQMIAKKIWKTPILIDTLSTKENDIALSFPITKDYYLFTSIPQKLRKNSLPQLNKTLIPPKMQHENALILSGNVEDLYSNKALEAQIDISNPQTKRIIASYSTKPEDGSYYIVLPQGKQYDISVHKANYSYRFTHRDVRKLKKTMLVKKDFLLYGSISLFLNVFDAEDFSLLDAKVTVKDANTGEEVKTRITKERKGRYILGLDIGRKYYVAVQSPNHLSFEMPFSLDEIVQFNDFEKDVELKPTYEDIKFDISNSETDETLDSVEIFITDSQTGNELKIKTKKNKDGKYVLKLKKGRKYKIKVKAPKGYAFFNTNLDMTKEVPKKMDIKLEPLTAKTKLTFSSIQFETNSAEIDLSSFQELDELVELMKDNPNMKVEISAHTDDVGSAAYNLRLSEKRAQSVVNYLIQNGVNTKQLVPKGYGESKPIVPNDSDENRSKNRRVELQIMDVNLKNE